MEYQLNVWQLQTNSDSDCCGPLLLLPSPYDGIAVAHVDQMANESIIITATMSFTIPQQFFPFRFILIFAQTTKFLYLIYSRLFRSFLLIRSVLFLYVYVKFVSVNEVDQTYESFWPVHTCTSPFSRRVYFIYKFISRLYQLKW